MVLSYTCATIHTLKRVWSGPWTKTNTEKVHIHGAGTETPNINSYHPLEKRAIQTRMEIDSTYRAIKKEPILEPHKKNTRATKASLKRQIPPELLLQRWATKSPPTKTSRTILLAAPRTRVHRLPPSRPPLPIFPSNPLCRGDQSPKNNYVLRKYKYKNK